MALAQDLRNYSWNKFQWDLVAAITVAIILVPQGMAYALLAGLPPVFGLYAGLVPLFIYPWLSSSKTLSVGPVALMSILVLSSVGAIAEPGSDEYIQLVLLTALMSGVIQFLFGLFKLGFISNFLSRPVMNGFVSAAGIIIAISQIKYLFTLDVPRSSSIVQMILDDFGAYQSANLVSFILGISTVLVILLFKRISKRIPRYLVAVILGTVALFYLGLEKNGVPIVGHLDEGLPLFTLSFISFEKILLVMPMAFMVAVICFIGSFSIAETVGNTQVGAISANKELMSLGLAKMVGSFFMAMPTTGSFTRSAVNAEAGAVTGMSSILTAVLIGFTLLFLGPLFYYLPEPVLAGIVITSVFSLIKIEDAKYLWNLDRRDFWVMMSTFILTLVLGIVNGIVTGIVLSLLSIIQRSSRPHFAELGRLPNTHSFRNIKRYPEAKTDSKFLILRYDQDLFFGNGAHFYRSLVDTLKSRPGTEQLILHLGAIHHMDSTALRRIWDLMEYCTQNKVYLVFTNLSGPIRDLFQKAGIFEALGEDHFHLSVAQAVLSSEPVDIDKSLSKKYARRVDGPNL